MKRREAVGLVGLLVLVGCIEVVVKPPVPPTPPSPSPVVSAAPTPAPTPTAVPTADPTPTPSIAPTPGPIPPRPSPTPPPCASVPGVCNTCNDVILQALIQGNWNVPRSEGWPGRNIDTVREDGATVQREPYDNAKGRGMAYNRGDAKWRVDRQCNRVAWDSDQILNRVGDGYLGPICGPCGGTPSPKPTPNPDAPGPVTGNHPAPASGTCPASFRSESLAWTGVGFLTTRPCSGDCRKDGYVGYIVNISSTPHSRPPFCGHKPGNACEQWQVGGGGCQDPDGPEFTMSLRGGWQDAPVDKRSNNNWNAHHKPRFEDLGETTFQACPAGVQPGGIGCGWLRMDLREDGVSVIDHGRHGERGRAIPWRRGARKPTVWAPEER